MPPDAIANFQYYAYECLPLPVKEAFEKASIFNQILVARVRVMWVTYLLSDKLHDTNAHTVSQGYIKGNAAILPQDTLQL